jgi:hypothetical protein
MAFLHICNTFFELELENQAVFDLNKWLEYHPAIEQLQYLPLLYAGPNDCVGVSKIPLNGDSRLCLIDAKTPLLPIESWGASASIELFAASKGLPFKSPPIFLVKEIQSKEFACKHRPFIPGTALLYTREEVANWVQKTKGPKVLKKILGFAGQGHFFIDKSRNLSSFLEREFTLNRPVLAEPWLDRKLDFSSQWDIGETIALLGLTTFETSEKGSYSGTFAGSIDQLFGPYKWAVDKHLEAALPILQKIQELGFFGSIGVDAFVYGDHQLQPIVEINARKTMSRVALMIQQQRAPNQILKMSFEAKPGGVLPGNFSRNVFLEIMPRLQFLQ